MGAAPTGVASEAEYVEISVAIRVDLEQLRTALDDSLPDGIDVVDVVEAPAGTSLPDRVQASQWEVRLPDVPLARAEQALAAFLAAPEVLVQRLVKDGVRTLDARAAVVGARVAPDSSAPTGDTPRVYGTRRLLSDPTTSSRTPTRG